MNTFIAEMAVLDYKLNLSLSLSFDSIYFHFFFSFYYVKLYETFH